MEVSVGYEISNVKPVVVVHRRTPLIPHMQDSTKDTRARTISLSEIRLCN